MKRLEAVNHVKLILLCTQHDRPGLLTNCAREGYTLNTSVPALDKIRKTKKPKYSELPECSTQNQSQTQLE